MTHKPEEFDLTDEVQFEKFRALLKSPLPWTVIRIKQLDDWTGVVCVDEGIVLAGTLLFQKLHQLGSTIAAATRDN